MSSDGASRRELNVEDFLVLAETLRAPGQPQRICRALERLSGEIVGHRLFTVMRFDEDRSEVERIHSSLASAYPVGGRKQKRTTAWSETVLREMKVFRGNTAADIQAAFDDHQTILGLGLGAVLNIPVVFDGRCLGTMNLLHQAGWYRPEDESIGLVLGAFLVPALRGG